MAFITLVIASTVDTQCKRGHDQIEFSMVFALSEFDEQYVAELTSALNGELPRNAAAQAIKKAIERHRALPINGLIRSVVTELECHLGIYDSAMMDYAPIDPELTFDNGLTFLMTSLANVLHHMEPPQLYQLFIRWIQYEGDRIEVRELAEVAYHFSLLKSISSDDYFFLVWRNQSAAYYQVLVKIDNATNARLVAAVAQGDLAALGRMADSIERLA